VFTMFILDIYSFICVQRKMYIHNVGIYNIYICTNTHYILYIYKRYVLYLYMYIVHIRTHRRLARLIVGPIVGLFRRFLRCRVCYIFYIIPLRNRVDFIHNIADMLAYILFPVHRKCYSVRRISFLPEGIL